MSELSRGSKPKASIIIVNYNAGDWLIKCAASLITQTVSEFECFIVDNGSTDGSIEALGDLDERFVIIKAGENLGFAAGNNLAAKRARADYIILLNPDAFARPDWLAHLLSATQMAPNIAMVGSAQFMAADSNIYDGMGDFYHISGLAWRAKFGHAVEDPLPRLNAFGPCGASALYEREMFLKLGGFDEHFFCYHEDVDIAFRFRLLGARCIQSNAAIIDHVSSGISGRASDFAVYHGTRNRIWTFFKNMPLFALLVLTPIHIAMNVAILTWSAFRPGRFKPTFRGMKDGVLGLPRVFKQRSSLHRLRTISSFDVFRQLSWNPSAPIRRDIPPQAFKTRR